MELIYLPDGDGPYIRRRDSGLSEQGLFERPMPTCMFRETRRGRVYEMVRHLERRKGWSLIRGCPRSWHNAGTP